MSRLLGKALPASGTPRLLAVSWLVNTIGGGLYLPTSSLYFTRVVGLPVAKVGIGLTVAGLVALTGAVPIGNLADRYGPRRVFAVVLAVQCAAMLCFTAVRSFPAFLACAMVFTLADQGSNAARGALVAAAGEGAERVRLRACLRVVTNLGMGAGAVLAALAIQADGAAWYTVLLAVNAATFLGAAVPLRWLPPDTGRRGGTGEPQAPPVSRRQVLRDARYVCTTALSGVLNLQLQVISFAVPLWVVDHTSAPRAMVSVIVVVNAVMVVLFQMRASRGVEDDGRAAALCRRAGVALLAACAVAACTGGSGTAATVGLLLAFAVLLTLGELWTSAGGFGLSFQLAPESAHGQYQGFFSLGKGSSQAMAPSLLAALCLGSHPTAGWLALGGLFAVAGLLMPVAVRRVPGAQPAVAPPRPGTPHDLPQRTH
ncbi:MFS transporter [Streptomyces sp. NPDC048650]|uniref:MFS transporter n=1 Tax=Streptomyces sp. NPDC048650 TaxID=3365583 RepID=UPI00371C62AA